MNSNFVRKLLKSIVAERVNSASEAFWAEFADGFPELTSGDSHISGEDKGVLYRWVTDREGDYPKDELYGCLPDTVDRARVDVVVAAGLRAAELVLKGINLELPEAPDYVRSMLTSCVMHVLELNYPSAEHDEAPEQRDGEQEVPDWTSADSQSAAQHGWNLFNLNESRQHGEIQADDEAARFSTDEEAIEFVKQQAKAGDATAAKALQLHGLPAPEIVADQILPKGRTDQLDLIVRLVQWAENTGGWDSPVWQEAAALVGAGQVALDGRSLALVDEARRIAVLALEGEDELVLDAVVHAASSAIATDINNQGAEAQVKYLLSNGWTEAMILTEAGLGQAPIVLAPGA